MKAILITIISLFCISLSSNVFAQEFFVYPAAGQSQEQTEKDKFECYNWARNQTNFDPMALPTATSAPPAEEPKKGGTGTGLLRGAAVGTVAGAIAGDTGKGAAIGAVSGGLIGGARRSQQTQRQQAERQQWEQQQASQYANARNNYNRAYRACLEAREYSVK